MATISRLAVFWKVFFAVLLGGSAASAASQAETSAWNAAVSANTPEAYYFYLSLYPAGGYVDDAIAALGRLGAVGTPRRIGQVPPAVQPSGDTSGKGDSAGLY